MKFRDKKSHEKKGCHVEFLVRLNEMRFSNIRLKSVKQVCKTRCSFPKAFHMVSYNHKTDMAFDIYFLQGKINEDIALSQRICKELPILENLI